MTPGRQATFRPHHRVAQDRGHWPMANASESAQKMKSLLEGIDDSILCCDVRCDLIVKISLWCSKANRLGRDRLFIFCLI